MSRWRGVWGRLRRVLGGARAPLPVRRPRIPAADHAGWHAARGYL
jgi:hypothetical protein